MHPNGWFSANSLEHDEQMQIEHPIMKSGEKKRSYGIIQMCIPRFPVTTQ